MTKFTKQDIDDSAEERRYETHLKRMATELGNYFISWVDYTPYDSPNVDIYNNGYKTNMYCTPKQAQPDGGNYYSNYQTKGR
jgi:hypothetical protein